MTDRWMPLNPAILKGAPYHGVPPHLEVELRSWTNGIICPCPRGPNLDLVRRLTLRLQLDREKVFYESSETVDIYPSVSGEQLLESSTTRSST